MTATGAVWGLLAEFATPDGILAAARRTRVHGYRRFDAHTPYAVEGLAIIETQNLLFVHVSICAAVAHSVEKT